MKKQDESLKTKNNPKQHKKNRIPLGEPEGHFVSEQLAVRELLAQKVPDKSRAGGVDDAIAPLVDAINKTSHYYTTSSCAGRLIVTANAVQQQKKKSYGIPWLFVTHDMEEFDAAKLLASVRSQLPEQGEIWLKLEPPILAIAASGKAAAHRLMNVARGAAGIKRCSAVSFRADGAVVLAVADTRRVECLLGADGQIFLDETYISRLLVSCRRKLGESRDKFQLLVRAMENIK